MAPRIVAGLFQSEGTAEDACHRLKTEGVPAVDIGRKVLKEIGRPQRRWNPGSKPGFLARSSSGIFVRPLLPISATARRSSASRRRPTSRSRWRSMCSSFTPRLRSGFSRGRKVLIREPYNEMAPR